MMRTKPRPLVAMTDGSTSLVVQGTLDGVLDCIGDAFRFRSLDALFLLDESGVGVLVDPCRQWKITVA